MAYTTPITFVSGDPLTAAQLNAIQDNIRALKVPPNNVYTATADYSTTSTTPVDIDSTNMNFTITTTGGDVLVIFSGVIRQGTTAAIGNYFYVVVDGTTYLGRYTKLITTINTGYYYAVNFSIVIPSLSAGSHTFKMQWQTTSGTLNLYGANYICNFAVREI